MSDADQGAVAPQPTSPPPPNPEPSVVDPGHTSQSSDPESVVEIASETRPIHRDVALQPVEPVEPEVPAKLDYSARWSEPQARMVGEIVRYMLTAQNAADINRRREHRGSPILGQAHVGNLVSEGDIFPMMVVRVWGSDKDQAAANGQVFLDGSDTLWVTSVMPGTEPGCFG